MIAATVSGYKDQRGTQTNERRWLVRAVELGVLVSQVKISLLL